MNSFHEWWHEWNATTAIAKHPRWRRGCAFTQNLPRYLFPRRHQFVVAVIAAVVVVAVGAVVVVIAVAAVVVVVVAVIAIVAAVVAVVVVFVNFVAVSDHA